ncbi:methyltransferase domain-containing protein [Priestia megaterium]|uniref:Methyltransferase domain-containing protein n=2 Tax=Bacillaceae TaxID=186817 RepID=A0A6H1NWF9_PRIMG|nr:methyltransferase domain-containing protein [Priestia megaterium]QIZ05619.1 methyltransferase domain-containing protein [Priestia megaterium]
MTKKPLDRISEAYKGDMGEDFSKKTRNRINWIVNHVKGDRILDIGCSQGVVPIILGREGKNVDAIDIAQESIDYANIDLKNEHPTVQQKVSFRVSNFMTEEELAASYETILLTEVLEHISDPYSFLKKIFDHLELNGRLVVTVPFGINDYFDHKRTYYFLDLYDHLSKYFSIEKIEYLGNWVGVVCKNSNTRENDPQETTFDRKIVGKLEKAFYTVERELVTRIENFQLTLRQKNDYIKNLQAQHSQYIDNFKQQVSQRDNQIKTLNDQIIELKKIENKITSETLEEKETNRKLLQQIKEQNIEFNSLINNVDNQHRRYIEKFEELMLQKEREIGVLRQKEIEFQIQHNNAIAELHGERETNRRLLQQVKDQNYEICSLIEKVENHQRIYIQQFDAQIKQKEREVSLLEETIAQLNSQLENSIEELVQRNTQIKELKEKLEEFTLTGSNRILELEEELGKNKFILNQEIEKQKVIQDELKIEIENNKILLVQEMEKREFTQQELNRELEKNKVLLNQEKENNKVIQNQLRSQIEEKEKQRIREIGQLNSVIKQLEDKSQSSSNNDSVQMVEEMKRKDDLISELNKQVVMLKSELLNSLNNEEKALQHSLKEKEQIDENHNLITTLEKKLNVLEKKYLALKNSKLGSFTLKYWQFRRNSSKKLSRG